MPIPFTCPHCGTQTNVDDQYAGQSGPCTSCGQQITVPLPGGVSPAYSPPARSSSGPVVAIIIVAVLGGVLVFGGILVALLLPAVQAAREAARRSQCSNNLSQIGLAMLTYHDAYGTLPPAVIADENGRPMHSWRVAILPFMEQASLHEMYDSDVPWDDPNNQLLMGSPIMAYQCPSDPSSSGTSSLCDTNYVMVVGKGAVGGEPNEAVRISDIRDGTSNTILAIEVGGSGIPWMEPRDVTVEEAVTFITNPSASQFRQVHPGGINVLLADGSVQFISNDIDPGTLRALLTKDDGQAVGVF
jgi:prepilin-type processing-associated H-X9-DG protein